MTSRPDRDAWEMEGALWLAKMGDCTRRQVGAVIFGPDKRLWGAGYNGSYPGGPSCLKGACPRGRHYQLVGDVCRCALECKPVSSCPYLPVGGCACGNAWPCPDAVKPGSSYDTGPGACIATHAEGNAKTDALRRNGGDLDGCRMVVSREPCDGCVRDLRNTTRLTLIRWPEGVIALP